ncbi:hypothetical protein [Pseudonocardia sp.]|uniref:hypothetical protein n=1 Tax=Pseudonocardia sp. TaxID=60912 RepID=UPI003D118940
MQITKTARRAAVGAVVALPLVLGVPGVAFAGGNGHGGGHSGGYNGGGHGGGGHGHGGGHNGGGHNGGGHGGHEGGGHGGGGNGGGRDNDCDTSQTAAQGGSLADVTAAVNPALNVGNILNLFGTQAQNAVADNNTNSGIQQFGCGDGRGQGAFQAGDLVSALVGVNPAANVGNIGNVGGTQIQNAEADNNTNSGIQQAASGRHQRGDDDRRGGRHQRGGHDGADQTAVQGPNLIGITADVSPALNVGNILNLGGTQLQNADANNNTNSGVQQGR